MVAARTHSVCLPHEDLDVLQVGSCLCGWRIGYDCSSFDAAMIAAQEHCETALELELDPERQ